jgi:hypothetical protein
LLDAGYGDVHAEHQAWVKEAIDRGVEKSVGGCGTGDAAGEEKAGDGGWAVEVFGERDCGCGVSGVEGPLPRPGWGG